MKKIIAVFCFLGLFLTINTPGFAFDRHNDSRAGGPYISFNIGYSNDYGINRNYVAPVYRHDNGYHLGQYKNFHHKHYPIYRDRFGRNNISVRYFN